MGDQTVNPYHHDFATKLLLRIQSYVCDHYKHPRLKPLIVLLCHSLAINRTRLEFVTGQGSASVFLLSHVEAMLFDDYIPYFTL